MLAVLEQVHGTDGDNSNMIDMSCFVYTTVIHSMSRGQNALLVCLQVKQWISGAAHS